MKCPNCEGSGYDTWFENGVKFQDRMTSCVECNGKGEVKEGRSDEKTLCEVS